MLPEERDAALLQDMLNIAQEAQGYVARRSEARFLQDRLRQRGLERTLEVLGEAAARVSKTFQAAHTGIDWSGMVGQRNVIAHKYGEIDHALIYRTAKVHLPPLVGALRRLISLYRAKKGGRRRVSR